MLALLGLLGLAVAGTALVGAFPSSSDEVADGADLQDGFDTEPDDVPDLLSILDDLTNSAGEVLVGDDGNDALTGEDGSDYLEGQGGDDALSGGAGEDQLTGGLGNDLIEGQDGDDKAYGDLGDDGLSGGDGDDTLHGGSGADYILGGTGNDEIAGGYDDDTLIGGEGRDMIQGSDGNDVLDGATGEDVAEVDYLNGSEGNDHLIGNNGDVMSGGEDADRFEVVSGTVSIMDYTDEDVLVLRFEGDAPTLSTEVTNNGVTLLADGAPVASLYGLSSFDVALVELVAA